MLRCSKVSILIFNGILTLPGLEKREHAGLLDKKRRGRALAGAVTFDRYKSKLQHKGSARRRRLAAL
jgi:hypothetical protein